MNRRELLLSFTMAICCSGMMLTGCSSDDAPGNNEGQGGSPYIARVYEYVPAPGQFVNQLPEYKEGDNAQTILEKVNKALCNNARELVTLGGLGGYVTVGFDHKVENKPGKCDFRVLGNAFSDSSEPGIIMVSVDTNGDGLPNDEWYEIAGSAYHDATGEEWYEEAVKGGNDMKSRHNYSITYYRPQNDDSDIVWEDSEGTRGKMVKNRYHQQSYYPMWIGNEILSFEGISCLPQNSIKVPNPKPTSDEDKYIYHLKPFTFGYADNMPNTDSASEIDIDWAVDRNGNKVYLEHIDFIRIYTGVNMSNGWIGESSTEVMGVEVL